MSETFVCPVCGYPGLFDPPWSESSGGSYEICPSCGFEFGYTDDVKGYTWAAWRKRWVERGMPWDSDGDRHPPPDWNPAEQLATVVDDSKPHKGEAR